MEWNEVCGEFDDKDFGNGKDEFLRESKDVGGQEVVYKSRQVV